MASERQNRANARAQSLGYRNYYDYRIHGYGIIPPAERISGEQLARARGHRSASDLKRDVGPGDVVSVWTYGPRDKEGRYQWVDILLLDASGRERIYRLRGSKITARNLDKIAQAVDAAGAVVSPAPSLDIRRFADELDEGADE